MGLRIDALSFIGPDLFGAGQSSDELLARMDAAHVDAAVVTAHRPPAYELGPANDAVAAAVTRSGSRLTGLARVDPNQPSASDEARRAIVALGLRGLFLHPREEVFPIIGTQVHPVIEVCAEQAVPVVVASGYPWVSEALQVADLARQYPQIPFVMTNGGQFNISGLGQFDAELAMHSQANVLIHTSGVYRQDFIERAVASFGADRVLFASASPYFDTTYELLRIDQATLASEDERDLILAGNARAIFGMNA